MGRPRNTSTAQIVSDVMNRLRTGGYTTWTLACMVPTPTSFVRQKEHIASSFVILMRGMNLSCPHRHRLPGR
jgi:hypothetical protein